MWGSNYRVCTTGNRKVYNPPSTSPSFSTPAAPKKVLSFHPVTVKVDSATSGLWRYRMRHAETERYEVGHAQRSVQTRKGSLPSGKGCFILNTFPLPALGCSQKRKDLLTLQPAAHTPSPSQGALQQPNHSLPYQPHNLEFLVLGCFPQRHSTELPLF